MIHDEITEIASKLAEDIRKDGSSGTWIETRVRHALRSLVQHVDSLAARSLPKSPICGYTETGRANHRAHHLRTFTGYGWGCDICGGCHEDVDTELSLAIGSHKFSLNVDLCRACAIRLVEIVEARIHDGRRSINRKENTDHASR